MIRHPQLGRGRVLRVYVDGTDDRVIVDFDICGEEDLRWVVCGAECKQIFASGLTTRSSTK